MLKFTLLLIYHNFFLEKKKITFLLGKKKTSKPGHFGTKNASHIRYIKQILHSMFIFLCYYYLLNIFFIFTGSMLFKDKKLKCNAAPAYRYIYLE